VNFNRCALTAVSSGAKLLLLLLLIDISSLGLLVLTVETRLRNWWSLGLALINGRLIVILPRLASLLLLWILITHGGLSLGLALLFVLVRRSAVIACPAYAPLTCAS